ncbi:MAG: GMC family oxidoreductase [Proteobacteria bacterium]|nr:GMC family oxidoreductase [Pseudomonadota bacterium]
MYQISTRPQSQPECLSSRERQILFDIAEVALPAGQFFPAANGATVRRIEALLAKLPGHLLSAYKALLVALESYSLLTRRRRYGQLSPQARLAVLDAWLRAGVARRLSIRALLAPLKFAHFDDPSFHRAIGCVYEFERPRSEAKPRYMRERVHGPDDVEDGMEIEADVVVIGSGAGGAVVAKELAELGHAVVILEEGPYFNRSDFSGRSFDMQRKMYRNGGATFSIGNVGIPIPLGRAVGGTTTINSGTCFRTPERVLSKWRNELGLSEFTESYMDRYYSRVEKIIGVEEARAEYLGGAARVIARGCDRLGYKHRPLRRNAPDCDGKGVCCFGCPTEAKRSTNVSYVPLALKAGAELFHSAEVVEITTDGARATGVVARVGRDLPERSSTLAAPGPGRASRTLRVRARVVVVACGTLVTPILLAKNGLGRGSGELGRNLSIHPAAAGIGVFDERIAGYNGIPQGYSIEEFHDEGLLFEGASAPLEISMAAIPMVGPPLIELAEAWDRVAMFGFMVEDSSRGRIRLVRGRPVITYVLNDADVALVKRGVEILSEVFFAAGATRVYTPVNGFLAIDNHADLDRLRRHSLHARDIDLTAFHPLGTARMGRSPRYAVVDPSHESHEVKNLYIVDGSSVPSSLAVNPQVTIMALATRAAERIDARLARTQ